MTLAEIQAAACESKIACLKERDLLIVIAEAARQGAGGGGGGGSGVVSDGVADPVAAPSDPSVANWYVNTATGTAWLWPAGGAAWAQIV